MTKEIKEVKNDLPAQLDLFEQDAQSGVAEVDHSELITPRLKVLQDMSPQCKKSDPAYIKEAEAGMFFINTSNELLDGEVGVKVVPVCVRQIVLEWNGDNFVAAHDDISIFNNAEPLDYYNRALTAEVETIENGVVKVETCQHTVQKAWEFLVLIVKENKTISAAVLSFNKSKYKHGRQWATELNNFKLPGKNGSFTPASFYHLYELKSVVETNKNKQSYYVIKPTRIGDTYNDLSPDVYKEAQNLCAEFKKGNIKVAQEEVSFDSDETI
jgi:hypothetical protein